MRAVQLLLWAIVVVLLLLPLIRRRARVPRPPPLTDELVKDPVCQTYVVRSRAVRRSGSAGLYFCSPECARRYAAENHG